HNDSGDDGKSADKVKTYDAFFYEKHNNAGLMDILRWGNLNYIQAGVSLKPMDNTTVDVRYLMFKAVEKADGTNFGTGYTLTTDNTKDDIGSEIDVAVTHNYEGGFSITARLGQFMPGDRIVKAATPTDGADNITQAFL